ncbi:MAG: AAA family ATPase [Thermodesulfobacteriota bacterium]|nr:AAA family ATPase [Thermodesulfobacteriota bacterium]
MNRIEELEILIRARYPLILVETHEEARAESIIAEIAKKRDKKMYCWSITRGVYPYGQSIQSKKIDSQTCDPIAALNAVLEMVEPSIFAFKDLHPFMQEPTVVRRLREISQYLKNSFKTLILVSPHLKIPVELEKEISALNLELPDLKELDQLLDQIIKEVNEKNELKIALAPDQKERVLKATLGLTLDEAENVFAKTLVMGGRLKEEDIPVILAEKEQIIKKSGLLEYFGSAEQFGNIGGLELLKEWLKKRSLAFTEKAKSFGLSAPKGVLLIGVQGCGKSLCAKALSSLWRVPLLRFDLGKVFSSLVGSSEENVRRAIQVSESVAPAILWIDEIEKAFAGTQSSSFSDAGTTARVFGSFITWLQEKTSPVFVIATANNIQQLPPELLRKGRFDEIFFVDLPSRVERRDIFTIHLSKRKRNPKDFDLGLLSKESESFSGAEIEEAIVSALFDVFEKGQELSTQAISKALNETVPLSRTMHEEIDALRSWATERARRASNPQPEEETAAGKRKLEI